MKNKITTTFKAPFTIVTYKNDEGKEKHFITVGKVRMQEEYDTFEECEKQIEGINWQLVTMLIEAYNIYLNNKNNK